MGVLFAYLSAMKYRKDGEPWNDGKPVWNKGVAMKPPFACTCAACGASMELRHSVKAERNRIYRIKRLGHSGYCSEACRSKSASAKISATLMGHVCHPVTPEGNARRRAALTGRTPWNRGKQMSETYKANHKEAWFKSPSSVAHLARIQSEYKGDRSPHWKGGITPQNRSMRASSELRAWRRAVLARDKRTCQLCGLRSGIMHADHIKPFATFPALRLDVNNGRTLCVSCHRATPTYGRHGRRGHRGVA